MLMTKINSTTSIVCVEKKDIIVRDVCYKQGPFVASKIAQ